MIYSNLVLVTLENPQENGSHYTYLVREKGTAHTAFAKRDSLLRWLDQRGLWIKSPIAVPTLIRHSLVQSIQGQYETVALWDWEEWDSLYPVLFEVVTMRNARYVRAKIVPTNGYRTVYTMNINVDQPIYPYDLGEELYG